MPKPNTYVQLLQAHLDRRLADVYKNRQPMDPFERRYPEIKPVTYNRKKCVTPDADCCILPTDVAAMMGLFKIARIATGHRKADNWVDLAGYAACGGELEGGGDK